MHSSESISILHLYCYDTAMCKTFAPFAAKIFYYIFSCKQWLYSYLKLNIDLHINNNYAALKHEVSHADNVTQHGHKTQHRKREATPHSYSFELFLFH